MDKELRKKFNQSFSDEKYQAYKNEMHSRYHWEIDFRLSETPVFLEKELVKNIVSASESIVDYILSVDIKKLTQSALEEAFTVPNEDEHPMFLAFDYGICEDENGKIVPKLIELQGFPSLFNYMTHIGTTWPKFFELPDSKTFLLTPKGLDYYMSRLKRAILNGHEAKHVVLLEIEPEKQSTAIDFIVAREQMGIKVLCLSKVILDGKKLYYQEGDERILIKRIYNRVIFDELKQRDDLQRAFNLTEDVDVEWAGHPNWFSRISKFLMPYLPENEFIPECKLLSDYREFPKDLENYVLKPLFSFSGAGVVIDVSINDINSIPKDEWHLFALQRKVKYAPIIETTEGDGENSKIEFRALYLWQEDEERPEAMIHLLRMSKGKMIGVKYNKDKTWVGSSVAFFDKLD